MDKLTQKEKLIFSFLSIGIIAFILTDAINDILQGGSWLHASMELLIASCLFLILFWLWHKKSREVSTTQEASAKLQAEWNKQSTLWRQQIENIKPNIQHAIDEQFERWKLTAAEQEISRLILKGLSNKEISEVRQSSELTVKQQTHAIFKKSGLANRSQLISFFLEDLL